MVPLGMQPGVSHTFGQAAEVLEVETADELTKLLREGLERAVGQPDAIGAGVRWLVAAGPQRRERGSAGAFLSDPAAPYRPLPLAQFDAAAPCDAPRRGKGVARAALLAQGLEQNLGEERVVSWRDGDVYFKVGWLIDRGATPDLARAAKASGCAGEKSCRDELVEVECRQLAGDAQRAGGLLPGDRPLGLADEEVQTPPEIVTEQRQRRDLAGLGAGGRCPEGVGHRSTIRETMLSGSGPKGLLGWPALDEPRE
jgi:hypothetical protein